MSLQDYVILLCKEFQSGIQLRCLSQVRLSSDNIIKCMISVITHVNASLISYLGAGPVTVAGRLAEVPPTAYPTQIAVARVRMGEGNCMKQGPDDRHSVA